MQKGVSMGGAALAVFLATGCNAGMDGEILSAASMGKEAPLRTPCCAFRSEGDVVAYAGNHVWSDRYGSTGGGSEVRAVATDSSDNVLVTGLFEDTIDFGGGTLTSAGGLDVFVAKLDASGQHVWSDSFGSLNAQEGWAIAVDSSDNVLIAGQFQGTVDFGGGTLTASGMDMFVAKLDSSGQHVWSLSFGDTNFDTAWGIAVDSSDNVLLLGSIDGTVDFGGGPLTGSSDVVVKLDSSGQHVWSKLDGGTDIAVDSADNVLLTGSFTGSVNFGGSTLTSAGSNDIYVVKLDSSGQHVWSQSFGDTGFQEGWAIAVDSSDDVLLTGNFDSTVNFGGGSLSSAGSLDVYVAKLASNGQHVWSQAFGSATASEQAWSIAVDSAGEVVFEGIFDDSVNFGGGSLSSNGYDIFLAKLDSNGQHVWSQAFGDDAAGTHGSGLTTDSSDNVVLTGTFQSTVDFGGGTLTSAHINGNAFIATFTP